MQRLCDDVYKYHHMGGDLGVAGGPDSVTFFSKTKLKVEKVAYYLALKFDLVLHSRFKKTSNH